MLTNHVKSCNVLDLQQIIAEMWLAHFESKETETGTHRNYENFINWEEMKRNNFIISSCALVE